MVGCSALREQIGQHMQDVARPDMPIHLDGKAFTCVLVDHGEHPERPATPLYEVIGPYMVPPAWPQTNARSVVQPQTAPLRLLQRDFQSLTPPDATHALVVHVPAFRVQQRHHPTVAVASILARQADDRCRQRILVVTDDRLVSLRRPRLPKDAAGTLFRDRVLLPHVLHASSPALGAYQFPSAASFNINLSSVNSATARFKRVFSASRSFRRRA